MLLVIQEYSLPIASRCLASNRAGKILSSTVITGKNICPPKQYLNGKNGTTITNPKDIANKHAAAFTDNSSSTHYSATFQAIKEQEEKNKIDFTSDNTEVYNKPFRLRDLRRSIMKTKPRTPGPDGSIGLSRPGYGLQGGGPGGGRWGGIPYYL